MIEVNSDTVFGQRGETPPFSLPSWKQVHGVRVARVTRAPDGVLADCGECDALWTDTPGVAVAVRTADCVPILLRGAEGAVVAAVHAGWRGTQARIAEQTLDVLRAAGWDLAKFTAWIGPSIGPCCYEVSPELAETFRRTFPDGELTHFPPEGTRPHLDLWRANAQQLQRGGVGRVEILEICTHCGDPELYASHRRDQTTDRQVSWAVCRSAASRASISG